MDTMPNFECIKCGMFCDTVDDPTVEWDESKERWQHRDCTPLVAEQQPDYYEYTMVRVVG